MAVVAVNLSRARRTLAKRCMQFKEAFMLVANLTRCNFVRDSLADCYCGMEDAVDGEYVKFEEAMEASSNSLQQLKAEIASVVCEMENCQPSLYSVYWSEYVNKLRQLSAV